MALLAELHDNGRSAERHALEADATVRTPEHVPADVFVVDLSATGCLFGCREALEIGAMVTIGITGLGRRQATVVRAAGHQYACEFIEALTIDDLKAVLASPTDTIVPFPAWAPINFEADAAAPHLPKWPGVARALVVVGMTAAAWTAIFAVRTALL